MATFLEGNWIQTEVLSSGRVSWAVVVERAVVQSGEAEGDDLSGWKAYEVGLRWAESNRPGVFFHWRHRALTHRNESADP